MLKALEIYILIGAACGTLVGIMVSVTGVWIGTGAGVSLLVGFKSAAKGL